MMQFYFNDLCIVGITKENVRRLQEGKPIHFELRQPVKNIGIVYGETKPAILDDLQKAGALEIPAWMREEAEKDPL